MDRAEVLTTDVWEWIPFLKRHARSIVLITVLTVAVTMVVSFVMPASYQSTATLVVQPLTQAEPLSFPSAEQLIAKNVGELLKSASVAKQAARSLNMIELKGQAEYRVVESSGLIEIIVTANSPQEAAREANAIADAFIALNAASLNTAAEKAQSGLDAELASLRTRIAAAEDELAAARARPNSADAVTPLQDKVDALNTAYEGVLQDSQVVPASMTELATTVLVADRAIAELVPVSPRPALNLLLSILGGLLLGIAFARARESTAKGHETGH